MTGPLHYLHADTVDDVLKASGADADGVAFVVRLGRRGEPVIGGAGTAGSSSSAQASEASRTPLIDALAIAREHGLLVELTVGDAFGDRQDTEAIAATVAALVAARAVADDLVLSSFDHAAVAAIGRGLPELTVGFRHLVTLHAGADYAAGAGAEVLHPLYAAASPELIERAHELDLRVHAWTLNTPFWPVSEAEQLEQLTAAGADAITIADAALIPARTGAPA